MVLLQSFEKAYMDRKRRGNNYAVAIKFGRSVYTEKKKSV